MLMYSPESLEAQKLISVSIGKINASRVTRTGSSLHKSLLVASVLHKARNVYLDEERERAARFPPCPPSPELTVTALCQVNNNNNSDNNTNDKENRLACKEDEVAVPDRAGEESRLPLGEANTGNNITHTTNTTTTVTSITNTTTITTTSSSQSSRKRRRVSDQETAAAISSILPKRLRSELKEESLKNEYRSQVSHKRDSDILKPREAAVGITRTSEELFIELKPVDDVMPDVSSRLCAPEEVNEEASNSTQPEYYTLKGPVATPCLPSAEEDSSLLNTIEEEESPPGETSSTDDSDSDGEDSSATSSANSSTSEEMEVDKLTSLVSYFGGFAQPQNQSEFCLVPLHHAQSGPHIVALTA